MRKIAFIDIVKGICVKDDRYDIEAYIFMREALDYTIKKIKDFDKATDRHVSGQELVEGIRQYALEQFGPITLKVLNSWGIEKSEDFGEIVFNLVNAGELGKTEDDKRDDFINAYDFYEVFKKPFLPEEDSL